MALEGLILFLALLCFLILLYIAFQIKKKPEEIDTTTYGNIMTQLGSIQKCIEDRAEEEKEEKEKRDKEMKEQRETLSNMLRTLSGTQKRGGAGEQVLKNILSIPIGAGIMQTDLPVGTKRVEFAYDLGDGKYIPIDAKMPQLEDLYKKYLESKKTDEQKKLKKEMTKVIKKHIEDVKKYKNHSNTIDKVILAIPDTLMNIMPELNSNFERTGVLVCGYSYVFFFGYYLSQMYKKLQESGDIGYYKEILNQLLSIIKEIEDKTTTIDRGIVMVERANMGIKKCVSESERHKLQKRLPIVKPVKKQKRLKS